MGSSMNRSVAPTSPVVQKNFCHRIGCRNAPVPPTYFCKQHPTPGESGPGSMLALTLALISILFLDSCLIGLIMGLLPGLK